jgi:acylphosphatase
MGELTIREVHLSVEGRVQGVGFRWFVRERARRWGLAGWVRNMSDGSVRLVARGHPDAVAGLLTDVGRGPEGAWVTGVIERALQPDEDFPDPFTIHR